MNNCSKALLSARGLRLHVATYLVSTTISMSSDWPELVADARFICMTQAIVSAGAG